MAAQAEAEAPPRVTVHAVPYAGIVTRAIGLAIDTIVVQAGLLVGAGVLFIVGELVGGIELGTGGKIVAAASWWVLTAAYFVSFWSLDGQTPGMRAMRLRVTTSDGGPLTAGRGALRVVALGLCIVPLFLGFLPVLFDERRRGLHDLLARTVVRYDDHA